MASRLSPSKSNPDDWLLLIAVAGAALWWFTRDNVATTAGAAVGSAAVNAGAGVVLGIGDAVGVPRTDQTQCQQDIAAGKTWDASFDCPALDFINYLTGSGSSA